MVRHFHNVRLTDDFRELVRAKVAATVEDEQAARIVIQKRVTKRLAGLEKHEDDLLDLLGDPDWPQDKLKAKLAGIRRERSDLSAQLASVSEALETGRQVFADALDLLSNPHELFQRLPAPERRLMALTVFGEAALLVDNDQIVDHTLRSPFAELLAIQERKRARSKPKSYQRQVGTLDAGWQDSFSQLEAEMKQDSHIAAAVLDLDVVSMTDLLDRALVSGHSSGKTEMVELRVPGFTT